MSDAPQAPVLSVVSGNPTPEELAALVLVVAAASSGGEEAPKAAPRGIWNHRGYSMRAGLEPGNNPVWAWRTGGFR